MRPKTITRTVAVAGALRRIGTTTQALQIVKYLNLVGYPAAYLEMSGHKFIDSCIAVYEGARQDNAKVCLCDIDMYRTIQFLQRAGEDYAFLVKDYGSAAESAFNRVSFMEQDIKVLVCGAKSDEICFTEEIIRSGEYMDASYIFSFVPDENKVSIAGFMEGIKTYFVEYTPDPFVYLATQNALYKSALNL
ncbi:MAG: hypothetical protein LIP16_22200 [Clostridium sp.]|nr:hypothetical protein [Clostridium sp.]